MQQKLISFLALTLLAVASGSLVQSARAEDKPDAAAAAKKPAADQMPFHGKIGAVDKTAKTITIEGREKGRTIQITSGTKIRKAGKPATLEDATPGEEVGGLAKRLADGKLEAVSLRVGPKPEVEKKKSKAKPEKAEKKEK